MMPAFQGFPEGLFDFFAELKANNSRDWFAGAKTRYKAEVEAPMLAFIAAMGPQLARIAPAYLADARPHGGSLFRIHRDTRFSKDKRPLKEHAACHFRHRDAARDAHAPGFYMHLSDAEMVVGGGVYGPPPPALARIRDAIAAQAEDWAAVKGALAPAFGPLMGDSLKRAPRGYDPGNPHVDDLKRKTIFVIRRFTPDQARRPDILDRTAETYAAAAPLMRFLCAAVGRDY